MIVLACVLVLAGVGAATAAADDLTWAPPELIDPPNQYGAPMTIKGISCPSATLCIGVDEDGNVVSSTDPGGGSSAWTVTPVDTGPYPELQGISCPTTSLCVAVDSGGRVLTSTDPTNGSDWTRTAVPGAAQFLAVSCASTTLCVALDNQGGIASSTDPTGGAAAWQVLSEPGSSFGRISCTSTPSVLCVAADNQGVLTSTDPTAGASAWTYADLGDYAFWQVSCPTSAMCVGTMLRAINTLAQSGSVVVSTDPAGGAADWVPAAIDTSKGLLEGVTCDEPTHCVAFDHYGLAFSSTDPAGGTAAWSPIGTIDSSNYGVAFMSCVPGSICVGVDSRGNGVLGSPPTPPPSYSLEVALGGDRNGGVTGAGLACPGTCMGSYAQGAPVTLTATPAAGEQFVGWSGACSGNGPCTVVTNSDQNVTATFTPLPSPPPETVVTPPAPPVTVPSTNHKAPRAPAAPAIARLTVHARTVTVTFASPAAGITLRCALVRRGTRAARPAYARCARTITFSRLRPGHYTIYARSLSAQGFASNTTDRAFTLRAPTPHARRRR